MTEKQKAALDALNASRRELAALERKAKSARRRRKQAIAQVI